MSPSFFSCWVWSHRAIGTFLMLQCGGGDGGPSPHPLLPPALPPCLIIAAAFCVFSVSDCLPLFPVAGVQPFSHLFPSSFWFHMIFVLATTPCRIPHECTMNMRLSSSSELFNPISLEFCPCVVCGHARSCWWARSSLQERNSLLTFWLLSREPRYRSQVEQRENSGIPEGNLEFLPTAVQTNKSDSETRNEAFNLK